MNRNGRKRVDHSSLWQATLWQAAVVLMAMSAAAGCKRDESKTTVDEVVEETARFVGQEVSVTGEVAEIKGDRAFVLEAGGLGQDQVLVLTKSPIRLAGTDVLEQGDHVRVTGVVHSFDTVAIEREVGWDLDPQMEAAYVNQAVIVAQSFGMLREEGVWREGSGYVGTADTMGRGGAGDGATATPTPPGDMQELRGGLEQVTVIIAAVRPLDMAGRRVNLENVPVRQLAGDKTFWIGESPERQMLVYLEEAGQEQKMEVKEGQNVTIQGTLQRMPAADEVIEKWGVNADMRNTIEGQPLYLRAERVEVTQSS